MEVSLEDIRNVFTIASAIAGVIGMLVGIPFGIMKWATHRHDNIKKEIGNAEVRVGTRVDEVHSRLNDTRQEMVSKSELSEYLTQIKENHQELRGDMRAMNTRMDEIVRMVAGLSNSQYHAEHQSSSKGNQEG